jgi:hypothetical protein
MKKVKFYRHLLLILPVIVLSVSAQQGADWVDGTVYKYIDDGNWCWFQDERAVIDTVNKKLVIGTANNSASSVDLTIFNIETKKVESTKRFSKLEYPDDHNSPGILIAPNGNYIAMWAHHYDSRHHYSIYSNGSWSNESYVNWSTWGSVTDCKVAYSNLYYLSDEKRILSCGRVFDRAPNFIYSDDNGQSWKYGGQLTTNTSNSYNKGYYKYWGNGKDRIDMVFTEEHPRDQKTSIYHGYIQNKKMYNTEGVLADDDIYSKTKIPTFGAFTKVFSHGTKVNGVEMGRCWQHDIARYDDNTIAILFKARANDQIDDHRNFYARYDGKTWKVTYIGKAGKHIYGNEHDYVGLGSLNPDDPTRIYICSAHNPGDDAAPAAPKREIWRGTTKDHGATWTWEPVTANSTKDNFRPIVPKWKPGKEAVLWFRGTYETAQKVYSEVVGTFYDYVPEGKVATSSPVSSNSQMKYLNCIAGMHQVTMRYQVQSDEQHTALKIFSLSGKNVATLVHGDRKAGVYQASWNTASVPSGTYVAQFVNGSTRQQVVFAVQN